MGEKEIEREAERGGRRRRRWIQKKEKRNLKNCQKTVKT